MHQLYMNSPLYDIYKKVEAGERISEDDGLRLYESNDLLILGKMAKIVRERKNEKHAYFTMNQHINPTNICRNSCLFCAFYRNEGQEGAYRMTLENIRQKVNERIEEDIREIHIVGGLDDKLPYEYYLDVIKDHYSGVEKVKKMPGDIDLRGYFSFIGELDLMIGMRLHSTLTALRLGVPSYNISYTNKGADILNHIGLGEYVIDLDEYLNSADELKEKLERSIHDLSMEERKIQPIIDKAIKQNLELVTNLLT